MNVGVLRSIIFSLGLASVVQLGFMKIQSVFVFDFLKSNITNLQVALLAINATTLGIVLVKIRDIIDRGNTREAFEGTRKEMILSIKEQISLIGFSLLILAMSTAKSPLVNIPDEIYHWLLLASFIYSIQILYDTAKSVFVILEY